MSTFTRLLAATALAVAMTTPAVAQTAPGTPQSKPAVSGKAGVATDAIFNQQQEGHLLSSDLVGLSVETRDGKRLGRIDGLILDDRHNVVGAILSIGGFLALGGKEVGVRWDSLHVQMGDQPKAMIDLSEQALADAPEFKTLADIRKQREDEQRKAQQRSNMRTPGGGVGIGGGIGAPPPTGPSR